MSKSTTFIQGISKGYVHESIEFILDYIMDEKEWDDFMENPFADHIALRCIEVGTRLFGWDSAEEIFATIAHDDEHYEVMIEAWEEFSNRSLEVVND